MKATLRGTGCGPVSLKGGGWGGGEREGSSVPHHPQAGYSSIFTLDQSFVSPDQLLVHPPRSARQLASGHTVRLHDVKGVRGLTIFCHCFTVAPGKTLLLDSKLCHLKTTVIGSAYDRSYCKLISFHATRRPYAHAQTKTGVVGVRQHD